MKFVVMAVIMVCMAAVFHVLFITMDYVFMHPTEGTFTKIQSKLNSTWDLETQTWVNNISLLMREFFGIGRVAIITMIPVIFVLTSVRKPKLE